MTASFTPSPPKNKAAKKRADELLAASGLARSRSQAQALIMAGEVTAQGRPVKKAGELWPEDAVFEVTARRRFVSRGGHKLEGALLDLKIDPAGLEVLDLGASTGGFTDCLLQYGAARVTAVDVGKNLLDWTLRQDPRVAVVEEVNAREIAAALAGRNFDLAVLDLSFISLALVLPGAAALVRPDGRILAMVKPQFEVGREQVGKNGVVRDPALIAGAVDKIRDLAAAWPEPWAEQGRAPSRLKGPEGNQEVFLLLARGAGRAWPGPNAEGP